MAMHWAPASQPSLTVSCLHALPWHETSCWGVHVGEACGAPSARRSIEGCQPVTGEATAGWGVWVGADEGGPQSAGGLTLPCTPPGQVPQLATHSTAPVVPWAMPLSHPHCLYAQISRRRVGHRPEPPPPGPSRGPWSYPATISPHLDPSTQRATGESRGVGTVGHLTPSFLSRVSGF